MSKNNKIYELQSLKFYRESLAVASVLYDITLDVTQLNCS